MFFKSFKNLVMCYELSSFIFIEFTFTCEAKWTQTGMGFHFGWKSHFGVLPALYLCSHKLRWNETQNGMDFIWVILTERKFQTSMRFACEQNLPKMKCVNAELLDISFDSCVHLKLSVGMDFILVILTEMNYISGDKISCKYYPKWNVHQNIVPFWNTVQIKLHVNRTCFHAGLKSQTGMSSFHLSYECTLTIVS